jgi:hypothetical protein
MSAYGTKRTNSIAAATSGPKADMPLELISQSRLGVLGCPALGVVSPLSSAATLRQALYFFRLEGSCVISAHRCRATFRALCRRRVFQSWQSAGGLAPRSYTPRLLAADARTRSADITDYYAGKTSGVELRGDQVGLKSCVRWNPVGTNGLPEGISRHRVSRQRSDVAPPTCAL